MPRIPPVPLSQLPEPLAEALARGRANHMLSTSVPIQIWAHRPGVALGWLAALEAMHLDGMLDGRLKELVRLRIAAITTCAACQLARKDSRVSEADIACLARDNARFSPAEQAALDYAERFAGDYLSIDDALFERLRTDFSTAELVELNMFCALMLAGGRMTYVQQAYDE